MAFMSYVRLDDKYEEGRLTELRQRLESEVKMRTGLPFRIFQDRQDIRWGQNWKRRIHESLDQVTFLIPILTPSFFESDACRDELTTFLEREAELDRGDLILPIYYVGIPALDGEQPNDDPIIATIRERQSFDWRPLRFEPPQSPTVGRAFEQLALNIRATLGEVEVQPAQKASPGAASSAEPAASAQATASETGAVRQEPPSLVVDPFQRGDYSSIGEALANAAPGTRLIVRPGFYREGVVVDKPIELVGEGERSEIVIQGETKPAVQFTTTMGRLANVTVRQLAGEKVFAVDVVQGRVEIEDCDITSEAISGVGIHGGADPRIRRCRIHHCAQSGIFLYEHALGILEENELSDNQKSGISISDGSSPTVRRNRISSNSSGRACLRGRSWPVRGKRDFRESAQWNPGRDEE
jgi:F-box protein 11